MTIHIRYQRSAAAVRGPRRRPDAPRSARGGRRDVFRSVSRRICVQLWTAAAGALAVHRRRASVHPAGSAGPQLPGHPGRRRSHQHIVGRRVRTRRGADRDALRPRHRGRDDGVSPGSCRRAHRDVRLRLRRRPVSVGDGLVRRPDAVRAACGHRLREPAADATPEPRQRSGRSTIGMPSIGTGMPP